MSLRRRPIETATYIPRGGGGGGGDDFVTDTGFSLTSSGAIGFSDDIERKLSSMSSSAGATTASSSAAALATASSSSSSAGNAPKISCNRDVLSSIKPYSRFGTAAAAAAAAPPTMMTMEESFSDDELAMMLGASIPQTPAKQIKNLHDAARAAKKDLLLKKENEIIGREQEILIEDAYTAYATKGRYNSAQKLIAANLLLAQQQKEPEFEVPQRIFGVYRRMTTRIKDEKTKQVETVRLDEIDGWIGLYVLLKKQCAVAKGCWLHARMNYNEYVEKNALRQSGAIKNTDLARLETYEEFISAYEQASITVQKMDSIKKAHTQVPKQTDRIQSSAPFFCGSSLTMDDDEETYFSTAGNMVSNAKQHAWKVAAERTKKQMHHQNKNHEDDGGSDEESPESYKHGAKKPTSWNAIRSMLQERTSKLQTKMMMNEEEEEENGEGMFSHCMCEDPIPVPIMNTASYFTCDGEEEENEMTALGSDMGYCTCSDPIRVPLATAGKARFGKKGNANKNHQHANAGAMDPKKLLSMVNARNRALMAGNGAAGKNHAQQGKNHPHHQQHPSLGELRMYLDTKKKQGGGGHPHHQHANAHPKGHHPNRFDIHERY